MKIVAIIQARMGSTRFPEKVLERIEDRPMLWHVINRLKASRLINKIVVATSLNRENNAIEEFCRKNAVSYFRGSEDDVLDRYFQAARLYSADAVVRITADCPLIDPAVTDKVISGYCAGRNDFDGASNIIIRRYPRGLDTEVVSFLALEEVWARAAERYQREHVSAYIYEHPELFRMFSLEADKDFSCLRWTVDEPADLLLVREIYKRLYKQKPVFLMDDILAVLDREPCLGGINKDIKQRIAGK